VWKLPVIFVCENNLYMEYTPIASVTAVRNPAADRAPAYGLPGTLVDGNDVVAVRHAVAAAADSARHGDGPTVIEALTYRHYGHSRTDPAKYRPDGELEEWLRRDPLDLARSKLSELGSDDTEVDATRERAEQLVADAVAAAQSAPEVDPTEALTDVWADGGSAWRT
jgi:acetoin:2,6-dichlorophenolindophenol oxidoreductase subunit alpha